MTVKRKAILISSPDAPQSKNLAPGTDNDMKKWRSFLESPKGGCWDSQDILDYSFVLGHLCTFIESLGEQDYVFVVYSGHGFQNTMETSVFESKTTSVKVSDIEASLAKISQRATLIVDSCRSTPQSSPSFFDYVYRKGLLMESYSGNEQAIWENALSTCRTSGIVTIYSCSLGESSSMQPNNESSLFSDQMLASPNKTFKNVLTIGKAFDYAEIITSFVAFTKNDVQNPKIELNGKEIGCFSVDYPFAVK